jgi:aminodeoxyfutalosine synthase
VTTSAPIDRHFDQVAAGAPLSPEALRELAATPDILALGMLADIVRRQRHGPRATYLRVSRWRADAPGAVEPAAREIRITGAPASLAAARDLVATARTGAEGRTVAAFAWPVIEGLAEQEGRPPADVLAVLREAGLDALASLPLDGDDPRRAAQTVLAAGLAPLRLTLGRAAGADDRIEQLLLASQLQADLGATQVIDPLGAPARIGEPTTGYDDVRMVALARLAAPGVPSIQVDWVRYGPKLAQVALTMGADDLDGVPASDEAPEGRRRAPLEDVRRNIDAAGFEPRERDGRFALVA